MSKHNGNRTLMSAPKPAAVAAPAELALEGTVTALAPDVESFTFDEMDRLRWALAEERVKSARMALGLAQQAMQVAEREFTVFREQVTAKYSESGKYQFVGSVELATGAGQRKLIAPVV